MRITPHSYTPRRQPQPMRFGMNVKQKAQLTKIEKAGQAQRESNLRAELGAMDLETVIQLYNDAGSPISCEEPYPQEMIGAEIIDRLDILSPVNGKELRQARLDLEMLEADLSPGEKWPDAIFKAFIQAKRRLYSLSD